MPCVVLCAERYLAPPSHTRPSITLCTLRPPVHNKCCAALAARGNNRANKSSTHALNRPPTLKRKQSCVVDSCTSPKPCWCAYDGAANMRESDQFLQPEAAGAVGLRIAALSLAAAEAAGAVAAGALPPSSTTPFAPPAEDPGAAAVAEVLNATCWC